MKYLDVLEMPNGLPQHERYAVANQYLFRRIVKALQQKYGLSQTEANAYAQLIDIYALSEDMSGMLELLKDLEKGGRK